MEHKRLHYFIKIFIYIVTTIIQVRSLTSPSTLPTINITTTTEPVEIYTIGGNSGGDPCKFPFVFMGISYDKCTKAGRTDGHSWCATTNNYPVDLTWGLCPEPEKDCEDISWVVGQLGNYCYQFNYQSSVRWTQAREICRKQNAELLSIEGFPEQTWIAGKASIVSTVIWLGVSDITEEGQWAWTDKTPLVYLNWKPGQPNSFGGNEDCGAFITRSGLWGDTSCNRRLPFICKKKYPKDKPETTAATTTENPNFKHDIDCYTGNGENYQGTVSTTHQNLPCSDWSKNRPNYNLSGNQCRNPDKSEMPWCYTDNQTIVWAYCNIPKCSGPQNFCEKGWRLIGDTCFKIGCGPSLSWQDAQNYCSSKSANLAIINSQDVQDQMILWLSRVKPFLSYDNLWIGINDRYHEMNFRQADRSVPKFTYWDKDQPDDTTGENDCVMMKINSGRWDEVNCELKKYFLCSKPPTSKMQKVDTFFTGSCIDEQSKKIPKTPGTSSRIPNADSTEVAGCPSGFTAYLYYCFSIQHPQLNWTQSLRYCKNRFGQKASLWLPHDKYEQTLISHMISKYPSDLTYHINAIPLKYNQSIGDFRYVVLTNSSTEDSLNYVNWDQNQPIINNQSEGIPSLYMSGGQRAGLWSVGNITTSRKFACMMPREGFTTPTPAPTTKPLGKCPNEWVAIGSRCFKPFKETKKMMSWPRARHYCQQLTGPENPGNGDLMSIHSDREHQLLLTHQMSSYIFMIRNFWIGLNRRDNDGKWQWSDGTPVDYTKWENGQPNNMAGIQECVAQFGRTLAWNDGNCNSPHSFICAIDRGSSIVDVNKTEIVFEKCKTDSNETDWFLFNGSCYYFSNRDRLSFYQAREQCQKWNADLVSISNQDELNFVHDGISGLRFSSWWIGLDMNNRDQEYLWLDGSTSMFRVWDTDEPNYKNKQETCVQMKQEQGFWSDANCGLTFSYICKRKQNTTVTTPPKKDYNIKGICPKGWLDYRSRCIRIFGLEEENMKTWTEARDICMARGGNLLSIPNIQQQAFMTMNLVNTNTSGLWIGLSMISSRWQMLWRDGTPYRFRNWGQGAHSLSRFVLRADHKCTLITLNNYQKGKWDTEICSKNHSYICELNKQKTINDYCMDNEYHGMKGYCANLTSNTTCNQMSLYDQLTCKKTCKMCGKFFQAPEKTPSRSKCAEGWFEWNNDCFFLTKEKFSWKEANVKCESYGAQLINIYNELLQNVAINLLMDTTENPEIYEPNGFRAWVGLKKKKGEASFKWTANWQVEFTNWGPYQPNDENGTSSGCVVIDGKTDGNEAGFWYNIQCGLKFPALCQKTDKIAPKISSEHQGACPNSSWVPHKGFCYLLSPITKNSWYQSSFECENYAKSALISIQSPDENEFVVRLAHGFRSVSNLYSPNIWLGLHKNQDDGSMMWSDNSPLSFVNWDVDEPDYSATYRVRKCYKINIANGKWASAICQRPNIQICKRPKIMPGAKASKLDKVIAHSSTVVTSLIVIIVLLVVCFSAFYAFKVRRVHTYSKFTLPTIAFGNIFNTTTQEDTSDLITSLDE